MPHAPRRVLVVTSIYPTPEDPGLGAFVASQVEALRRLGIDSDVLFLDVRRSKLQLLKGIFQVRRLVDTGDYDLVHAHFGYNGVPAVLQRQVPTVVSYCGTDLASRKLRPISDWVARRADALIVKTDEGRRSLGMPAAVIPNGVDLHVFAPMPSQEARRRLGLKPDVPYALFISDPGRPEKRFSLAEGGIEVARKAGIPVEPLIIRNRPHSEIPLWINAADVLLLTSTREGSPNVVKEAMACNVPVVSTDVGDVREVLGGAAGCSVIEDTPDAVGLAISNALKVGRSNGRDFMARLSSEAMAEKVLAVYTSVLNRESHR